ncbi:glycosyltransferase family 2 protein [Patescibacteria group bacterium]|nr:glycosyltransferase family 2 protein [Patescibacteria group bacterium]
MKKTSIIVPAFNEEKTILTLIEKLKSLDMEKEIIIIDDGSSDATRKILSEIDDDNIKIILKNKNQGKGVAIRDGINISTGDMIVIQDADLEYDPNDLLAMVKTMIENDYDVLYGSRFLKKRKPEGMYMANWIANKTLVIVSNMLYNSNITDEATCYKLFKSDVIKSLKLKAERFEFCPEVTAKVRKKDYIINEMPISYKARKFSDGKKIGIKDFIVALWVLIKYRFVD